MIFYKKNGFTLIELIIGTVIFSIIVAVISSILISSMKAQERAVKFQILFDQTGFLTEYFARSVRMARKSTVAGVCLTEQGANYELTRGGAGLKFITSECGCQEIYWDISSGRIKENKEGVISDLTSGELEVKNLKFNLVGETQEDDLQARVTILMTVSGLGPRAESNPELTLQTTISQRKLDMRQ